MLSFTHSSEKEDYGLQLSDELWMLEIKIPGVEMEIIRSECTAFDSSRNVRLGEPFSCLRYSEIIDRTSSSSIQKSKREVFIH